MRYKPSPSSKSKWSVEPVPLERIKLDAVEIELKEPIDKYERLSLYDINSVHRLLRKILRYTRRSPSTPFPLSTLPLLSLLFCLSLSFSFLLIITKAIYSAQDHRSRIRILRIFFSVEKIRKKIRNFANHRCLTCFDVLECNVHL